MKNIIVVGAGGFGREVAWLIEEINLQSPEWNMVGFVDDDETIMDKRINGYPVLGNVEWLSRQQYNVVVAVGNPVVKKNIVNRLDGSENEFPTLIHPNVRCSKHVSIGKGCIICAGTILTVNISVGDFVILNLDCTVGHDAVLGNFSTVYPSVNISGQVNLEEGVSLGTGSSIIQGLTVGKNAIIGSGSAVVRDIPADCTAVGIPAKVIRQQS